MTVRVPDAGFLLDGPGQDAALIFYPGAKVACEAYLPLPHALVQAGTDCFLTRMPGNLALLDINRAGKLMAEYSYAHWYLGGHSLGGVSAAMCASSLPADARTAVLPGGNHAQFGDYGPQKGDGAATVSLEAQVRWAVSEIQKLINGGDLCSPCAGCRTP